MNRHTDHQHHHVTPDYNWVFALAVGLNVLFVIIEAAFGFLADSLALLTDAGHNLSDVLGLLLAWGATALAKRKPSPRRTYGFSRATIIASLFSGLLLMGAVGAITWEALNRLMVPGEPMGASIMLVAGIGVVINTATAMLFFSGRKKDLNIRGAYIHMAADAAVSVGVVISGALIWLYGIAWLDPLISLLIAAVILMSTWGLLRDSLNLAVDAVPSDVDPDAVRRFLVEQEGVIAMHDLHIWAMSTTDTALTAHLVMNPPPDSDRFLVELSAELGHHFNIAHATIQIERDDQDVICPQSVHCAD